MRLPSFDPAAEAEFAALAGLSWDAYRSELEPAADRLRMDPEEVDAEVQRRRTFREQAGRGHSSADPPNGQDNCAPPSESTAAQTKWPEPLLLAAFHGIAGEIVALVRPRTEADDVAVLLQILAAFGNCVGKGPHVRVEGDRHGPVIWPVIVGASSKARKGTSWSRVRELFEAADPDWLARRKVNGLSSGEGLVWAIRDPSEEQNKDGVAPKDPGVTDKRLFVVESEFAAVLRQTERTGNTLSATLRDAWDGSDLSTLTKNNPARASAPHVTVVGHITVDELGRHMSTTEAGNGFANRFLFACVKRSQLLPLGGGAIAWGNIPDRLAALLDRARSVGQVLLDAEAREIWTQAYADLSQGDPGLLGAVTARMEAHALRLALVYALLDGADVISVAHLRAALAVIDYCHASARYVFGDALGDPTADAIAAALRGAPDGLNRTEISARLGRHTPAAKVERALEGLRARGMASLTKVTTQGRPTELWRWERS